MPPPLCLGDPPPGAPTILDQLLAHYEAAASADFSGVCQAMIDHLPPPPLPSAHACEDTCAAVGSGWGGAACGYALTVSVTGGPYMGAPCGPGQNWWSMDAHAEGNCGCECN